MCTEGLTMEKTLDHVDRTTYSMTMNQPPSPASPMFAQQDHEEGSMGYG